MSRRKKRMKQYGTPTVAVTVRIPAAVHSAIQTRANADRVTKSRAIVQMLADAAGVVLNDVAPTEDVFG